MEEVLDEEGKGRDGVDCDSEDDELEKEGSGSEAGGS